MPSARCEMISICAPDKRWEDVSSRGGGKWIVTVDSKRRKHDLDGYWLHLVRRSSSQIQLASIVMRVVTHTQKTSCQGSSRLER